MSVAVLGTCLGDVSWRRVLGTCLGDVFWHYTLAIVLRLVGRKMRAR